MGQPGNTLTNFLSLSTFWFAPSTVINNVGFVNLAMFNLKKFIITIIRLGFVYATHIFYNFLFFLNWGLITLPVEIDEFMFSKFYRIGLLKNAILGVKKHYLLRKSLEKIYFSSIFFFSYSRWIFVYILSNSLLRTIQDSTKYISYEDFDFSLSVLISNYIYLKFKFNLINYF